ncbi:HNH endonuclease [Nocardia sp. NPDC050793]|uniref:HNH endonuclease n=1 Tax=Nocardia sp. NPDC050793 TaxID=3155159 RepID=UPI0033DD3B0F
MDRGVELELREMIFDHLAKQVEEKGALTRAELSAFPVGNETRRLIDQNRGIWNPRDLMATLSIVSNPSSQYADAEIGDSMFAYSYRDGSTDGDNRKLRRAFELQLPVILLRWIRPGTYVPVFPVYVIRDDHERRRFLLALDKDFGEIPDPEKLTPIERRYARRLAKQRLHQPEFRGRVLVAYDNRCGICGLGYRQLLDAAHIVADNDEHGLPEVANGLCLCKIHHAAFDANMLGISPDYEIVVGDELMNGPDDGPMLHHGFREMHRRQLITPVRRIDRPAKDRLAQRFELFEAAS